MSHLGIKSFVCSVVALVSVLALYVMPVSATTTFTVNSTEEATDVNPGDGVCEMATGNGVCTLRAAIQESNALSGMDTIMLPSGTYMLTIAGILEDAGAFGDLDITDDLTLVGDSAENTIIDGNELDRVFHLVNQNAVVTMRDVTIQNGKIPVEGEEHAGGGINNQGTFTLEDSIVRGNSVVFEGGGIINTGVMTITRSTVSENVLSNGYHGGAGIFNSGVMRVEYSTINDHQSGSGIRSFWDDTDDTSNHENELTVNFSTLRNNQYGITIFTANNVNINNSVISDNGIGILEEDGLGDNRVSLNNTVVNNNVRGISFFAGEITLNNSVVSHSRARTLLHRASSSNGTESQFITRGEDIGSPGIYIDYGTLTLNHTTVNNNETSYDNSDGGGIYMGNGTFIANNSTISGNKTNNRGGGIFLGNDAVAHLNNVTITRNQAGDSGTSNSGGGLFTQTGRLNLKNTIIAGNYDNSSGSQHHDCSSLAVVNSLGYNLIQDTTGCSIGGTTTGNLIGVSPALDVLRDNGGMGLTHLPLPDSPALDAGNPDGCTNQDGEPFERDQRGQLRVVDGNQDGEARCDIGAVERNEQDPEISFVYLPVIQNKRAEQLFPVAVVPR